MKKLLLAVVIALIPSFAFAQTPRSPSSPPAQPKGAPVVDSGLATQTAGELNVSVGGYTYTEPGRLSISIHGLKIGGEYNGTVSFNQRRHWFARVNARLTAGNTAYDGWCSPFLIRPDSTSPNGWALDQGDASPCSESGDKDWYGETRGMAGKDFWAVPGDSRPRRASVSVTSRMAPPASSGSARTIISICPSASRHAPGWVRSVR